MTIDKQENICQYVKNAAKLLRIYYYTEMNENMKN